MSRYASPNSLPSYIVGDRCGTWNETPRYKPCTVTFKEDSYWTEAGLDRYRVEVIGEGIDVGGICGYVHDGRRCGAGSNRQCYEKDGKQFFDINFAKGGIGHGDYRTCFNQVQKAFKEDNLCD